MTGPWLPLTRRILRDDRGAAFIEFAFVAPILLLLILGGLELANYALAHMRVNQIAMTVADNAGRVTTGIDEANVHEVFAGAAVIGDPLDFEENGRIVLSSLQHNGNSGSDQGQMINWQRCWGDLERNPAYGVEDDGRDDNTLEDGMGRDGSRVISAPGTAVMVAEVYYTYQPLIDTNFMVINETIYHESAFNVRGRENNNLTNAQNLDAMTCEIFADSGDDDDLGGGGGSGSSASGSSSSSGGTSGSSASSSSSSSGGTSGNNGSSGSNNGSSGSNNGSSSSGNNGSSGNGQGGNGRGGNGRGGNGRGGR